jgi:phage-related protein
MRDILVVGGVSTSGKGIYVLDSNDETMPERDYEPVSVPGKSGDLHFSNNRYLNKEITYKCVCMGNAKQTVPAICSELLAQSGYVRIEDTLNPEYYKIGEFRGGTVPEFASCKDAARFDLLFDCKPQKWLKSGENEVSVASGGTLTNPTFYPAYPLLEITGSGAIGIGSRTLTITNNPGTLIFDCDIGDAYSKTAHANYNQYVTQDKAEKYTLESGDTGITLASGMTLKITPRWWFL